MNKYKNNKDGKIAVIMNFSADGMCEKTFSLTMVVYTYESDTYDYPFIMENREFHKTHSIL
jgi:hypothetical protein